MATYFGDLEVDIKITAEKKRQRVAFNLLNLLVKLKLWPSFRYNNQDCPMTPHHPDFNKVLAQLYGRRMRG